MGLFSKIFGGTSDVQRDAARIYATLMAQSRTVGFYAPGRMTDNYDGRIDVLTLHIACVLTALRRFDENGERLGQALFDEMKDDFEIALRELAIGDTGVAKRIKPMIALFYTRVKAYAEAIASDSPEADLKLAFSDSLGESGTEAGASTLAAYTKDFASSLAELDLGTIARADYRFPKLG